MLEFFRKLGATKASKVFLTLLALSFVAWGVSGYLVHVTGESAISVGGTEISAQQLDNVYRQKVARVAQVLGHAPSTEELAGARIAEGVVAEAIGRAVLRQASTQLGLMAPIKALQEEIAAMPAFRNDEGGFDPARYRAALAQIGRTPEQFEQEMGQDLSVRLLSQLVHVAKVQPAALAPQAALDGATLELSVATVPPLVSGGVGEPTADDLKRHYELNQKLYEKPEKRSFTVLEISKASIAKTVTISPEQVEKEYKDNLANFAKPETRTVRHILLDSEIKAKEVASQIHNLADFEKLANAESKDPGNQGKGGALGDISKDSVVPEFGNAAFAAKAGEMVGPVKSAYGWHLVWVEKIIAPHTQSFDEVKAQIEQQIRDNESEDALNTLLKSVDDKVAGGENLTKVAEATGLKAEPVAMVGATDQSVAPDILAAAFSTEMGQVSTPINREENGVAYVEVTAVVPAQVPPLEEIKDRVAADWKKTQETLAAKAASEKVMAAVRAQSARSVADAVAQSGVAGVQVSSLEVKDLKDVPEWLHRVLLDVFQLPVGATLPTVVAAQDGWHVVRLTKRTLDKPDAKALDAYAGAYQQRLQADVEALVVAEMQRDAKVECHAPRLRQVFGRDVSCQY